MKFYLDGENFPWVVNVGGDAAQCFLSGERCEFGEPLRIKAGDIVKVGLFCHSMSVRLCVPAPALHDWRDSAGIVRQLF